MSALHIEERITVSAPPARVWKFVLDPARVAACLPGAKLDGQEGPHTYLGTMKIKVGPVLMEMKGKASMSDINPEERSVKLTGTGNDKSGGGSAKMVMSSQILPTDDGGSTIVVNADVDLAGKLVRFGRGMMEGISKQLFKQFSERVRAELAQPEEAEEEAQAQAETEAKAIEPESPAAETPAPEKEVPDAVSTSEGSTQPAASEAISTETAKDETSTTQSLETSVESEKPVEAKPAEEKTGADEKPQPVSQSKSETESTPSPEPDKPPIPPKAHTGAKPAKKKAPSKAIAPVENEALDAGSLVWAAIWAWIKGIFSRLFGKKDKG
ncbi:MAG: SRPBCC family protein [Polyangiaceae bacterium]|nr:SRPBCC family protein [Polyangiaceae bacterium]